MPRQDTKTAIALPHCSESTKESIAGWWSFGSEGKLELWRNYETSYIKKTEVEVLPDVDLSQESFFSFLFVGDATQVITPVLHRPQFSFFF